MNTGIVWFRRDLRLADNPALGAALDQCEKVVTLYIHDPESEAPWSPGSASRWWLQGSLGALDQSLRALGGQLSLAEGDSLAVLKALLSSTGASAVYWNRLYEPALIERDERIKAALEEGEVHVQSHNGALLLEPWQIRNGSGRPYRVFTPFWRKVNGELRAQLQSGRAPQPVPDRIPAPSKMPKSLALKHLGLSTSVSREQGLAGHWCPGEAGARALLETFVDERMLEYSAGRDIPAQQSTSRLSAALHFGECSPLQLLWVAESHAAGEPVPGLVANTEHFLRQLGWREFSHHLLFHFPETDRKPLISRFNDFEWRKPDDYAADLKAWQRGLTGIPIVDAGMRQLRQSGWMHNRVRMIAASFLCKNLLIPWQEGARWFWENLVDADLANNSMGWQWSAGSGADAAPYFRVFNPVLQSRRFDVDGSYIRRWVPELGSFPDRAVHAPWEMKKEALGPSGLLIGRDYPEPIVDLPASRRRALDVYQRI